jgi:hypothetical protein
MPVDGNGIPKTARKGTTILQDHLTYKFLCRQIASFAEGGGMGGMDEARLSEPGDIVL